jgi:hypothetical protein
LEDGGEYVGENEREADEQRKREEGERVMVGRQDSDKERK